ncbi:AAA family ATPase [Pseudomonas baetica]|uniref:AAA family ATPase n=1 Tax=Pseudomonas baetica TaxID=674054 RepID=UPI0024059324|nr:AAA family ATPase [Pseudomonas baetica]MDF9776696.1 SpoVK/Ycf46/Vps4 family AAA+-type ATPase [Pseudomonas baetica]
MPIPRSLNRSNVCSSGPHNADTCALTLKWSFMMMLDLGGHRNLIQRHGFNDDELAIELGLQALIDEEDFHPRQALLRLKGERKLFDEAFTTYDYPDMLEENLEALGELLGLDAAELRILGFCVLMHTDPTLTNAADELGMLGFNRMLAVLSTLLDIPQLQLTRYLSNDGQLVRAGLLEVNTLSCSVTTLSSRLSVGNSDLPGLMRFNQDEPIELFKYAFRLSPPGTLGLDKYEHLRQHVDIAQAYLAKALVEGRSGVNILLYGPPGTGKTQLSRLLAKTLNTDLYEIACTDSDGDPVSASQRLCALRSAMSVLHSHKSLLVLDEIEDIFDSPTPMGAGARSKAQKGWINRMLEENALPCFWLSNSVESLDAAHIRRFDLVINLPNPPRAQREQIIRDCSADKLGNELVEKLIDHEHATPAVITRAVRIARSLNPRAGKKLDATVECLVDSTLKAQGFDKLEGAQGQRLPSFYSPELINTDVPLDGLVEGLRKHAEARLCFYGPPGTGKTAFGCWLAQELDRPLMVQRVSDLVSPYVGQTEQNLAEAFAQATQDGAVLLLDEVDSILQDRRKAKQSWEVTAVNEMLTQMESYHGLFIASTNLIRDLDEASLRRFDMKIYFGYLDQPQVQQLFSKHLQALKLKDPTKTASLRLRSEQQLTPGDFASVARQARFKPFANANALASALIAEARLKTAGKQRPIGFVH